MREPSLPVRYVFRAPLSDHAALQPLPCNNKRRGKACMVSDGISESVAKSPSEDCESWSWKRGGKGINAPNCTMVVGCPIQISILLFLSLCRSL